MNDQFLIFYLQFLPESIFISKPLSILLLSGHVVTLVLFMFKWYHHHKRNRVTDSFQQRLLSSEYIIHTLFVSNYIGIVFARTLHYQFYSWYFHSLPFLLWMTNVPVLMKIAIVGLIEYSFNVFPATFTSSLCLQLAHGTLLIALYLSNIPQIFVNYKKAQLQYLELILFIYKLVECYVKSVSNTSNDCVIQFQGSSHWEPNNLTNRLL